MTYPDGGNAPTIHQTIHQAAQPLAYTGTPSWLLAVFFVGALAAIIGIVLWGYAALTHDPS